MSKSNSTKAAAAGMMAAKIEESSFRRVDRSGIFSGSDCWYELAIEEKCGDGRPGLGDCHEERSTVVGSGENWD